jgi:hypothetical protein
MTPTETAAALALMTLLSCGAPPPAKPESPAPRVILAACLAPAKQRTCEPTFRVAFEGTRGESGELWCEDGRPRGRFDRVGDRTPIDGVFGEAVWEAIDRVLAETNSCVTVFGRPAIVTRANVADPCRHPDFDMTDLVVRASSWARHKLPVLVKRSPPCTIGICSICPNECKLRIRDPNQHGPTCEPYEGDEAPTQNEQ